MSTLILRNSTQSLFGPILDLLCKGVLLEICGETFDRMQFFRPLFMLAKLIPEKFAVVF